MTILAFPRVAHRYLDVDGVRIFYRESIPAEAGLDVPVLLLLHGFPSASHQFRRLIDAVGNRYRVIAPDYPGFGHSEVPLPASEGGTCRATIKVEFLRQSRWDCAGGGRNGVRA